MTEKKIRKRVKANKADTQVAKAFRDAKKLRYKGMRECFENKGTPMDRDV